MRQQLRKSGVDKPKDPLVTCLEDGTEKYLLGPAEVLGTDVKSASAGLEQNGQGITTGGWEVDLTFTGDGKKKFADITRRLSQLTDPQNRFGIVLDGLVVSAPGLNNGPIVGGQAQITGNFTQSEATSLANVLKYGALPLTFDAGEVQEVSATLGGDQLTAGLTAGVIGLVLVVLYSLLYYRGLGLVTVASLLASAILTYGLVVLLGWQIGFRLSLAGIAGLIVAIGITADSFIVYFERLRDEVRDGKSLRVAVEAGWVRARRTILAADFVSFLAAVVLYALSVGSVRGFAFTLGLTTLLDIAIVFMFTKPLMSILARTRFFGQGHRFPVSTPNAWARPSAPCLRRRPAAGAGRQPAPRPARRRPDHEPPHASLASRFARPLARPFRVRSRTRGGPGSRLGHLGAQLYRGDVSYDFISRRNVWYTLSAFLLLLSLGSLIFRGLTLGIEFRGGAEFRVKSPTVSESTVLSTVQDVIGGGNEIVVQTVGPDTVRAQTETLPSADIAKVQDALATKFKVSTNSVSTQFIGPSWGKDISQKALRALIFFLVFVVIFLSLYFEWKMALAAMIALIHDLVITAGLYSLVGFEVTPATVIGFLTILGYSLYDTVVVFDKVRENTSGLAGGSPDDLQPGRQPGGQPDTGPVDQHLDHRAAADRRDPVRRCGAARCRSAQGPGARAVRRCRGRGLLVHLHRDAAACRLQGARARDAGARQARRCPARRVRGHPVRPSSRGNARPGER